MLCITFLVYVWPVFLKSTKQQHIRTRGRTKMALKTSPYRTSSTLCRPRHANQSRFFSSFLSRIKQASFSRPVFDAVVSKEMQTISFCSFQSEIAAIVALAISSPVPWATLGIVNSFSIPIPDTRIAWRSSFSGPPEIAGKSFPSIWMTKGPSEVKDALTLAQCWKRCFHPASSNAATG